MKQLKTDFKNRDELADYVREITPWIEGDKSPSPIEGGRGPAEPKIKNLDAINYGRTRNHVDGDVTQLSPYVRHGIVTLNELRNTALNQASEPLQVKKFIQQLSWRDYWQRLYKEHPDWMWNDVEDYKTGYTADDYADKLPEDIATGETGVACIDQFIKALIETGYMHNHTRLYVASYVVHFRRIKWQAGAKWFLHHLLDGDVASNNLSWQWVASTFSHKPYIFNLGNVQKYTGDNVNTNPQDNTILDYTYDELNERLFPNKGGSS